MGCNNCGTMSPDFCNNCITAIADLTIDSDGAKCVCGGRIKEYLVTLSKDKKNDGCKVICLECKREVIRNTFIEAYKIFIEEHVV